MSWFSRTRFTGPLTLYLSLIHISQRRLVVDIGGRSTEMILGEGRKPLVAESFAAGCVSLSMRFFEGGNITLSLIHI